MTCRGCLAALVLVSACATITGQRWVWAKDDSVRRLDDRHYTGLVASATGDRRYTSELVGLQSSSRPLFQPSSSFNGGLTSGNDKLRYEVTEPPYRPDSYRPDTYRPERPIVRPQPPPYRPIPDYNRPRPIENEYSSISNGLRPPPTDYRPGAGPNGRPVLTGPVPSWEENNPNGYKDYDKCKCVHSFNCNTPGIKFGSCDVDKQYCCYRTRGKDATRPDRRPGRPVLAGPGGPVDRPGSQVAERPFRPFSNIDRYVGERDLDDAYRKGLASAIHELYDRPGRDYDAPGDSYAPTRQGGYGLYVPSTGSLYARSSGSNITAETSEETN